VFASTSRRFLPSWNGANAYLPPDLSKGSAVYIAAPVAGGSPSPFRSYEIAGFGYNPADTRDALYGGQVSTSRLTWTRDGFGGTFGSIWIKNNGDPFDGPIACVGDSGGPLYVRLQTPDPNPNATPKLIEFGVASYAEAAGDDNCPAVDKSDVYMRLETDTQVIDWINIIMKYFNTPDTAEKQKEYNACQGPINNNDVGGYYQCWGELCDNKTDSSLPACPLGKSCVGAGIDLNAQGYDCKVCPLDVLPPTTDDSEDTGDKVFSCSCVLGQCMWDPAKESELEGTGGEGGAGGGAGGAGAEGGAGGGTP